MTGATEALARFAVDTDYTSIPGEVLHAAKRAVMDGIGVAIAGLDEGATRIVMDQVLSQDASQESVVWGGGDRVSAQSAAMVNGTAAHALDYDDVSYSMPGHPTVPILPAVVALGEKIGASGTQVLSAFVVGVEIECKLGTYSGRAPYDQGWHVTTTLGAIGATAACARLLGMDVLRTRQAVGLAVSMAGGVRQNFGSMAKPFHVGRCAQSAILAAELVQRGLTASDIGIEGPGGFWDSFGGGVVRDGGEIAAGLGRPFELVVPGINFKPWPCCASTHASVDAAIRLSGDLITEESIETVNVEVPFSVPLILIHHRPTTPLAAKFSLEYCVAAALLDGHVGMRHFTPESVNRPDLQALLRRVTYRVPEEWSKPTDPKLQNNARLKVRMRDGSIRRTVTTVARGDSMLPLSDEELQTKFLACAAPTLGQDRAMAALEAVYRLERLENISQLTEGLRP